jgi:hypothetical protein
MESRFSFNVVVVFFVRFSAPPNFTQFAFDEELSPISFPPTRLKYAEKYALSHIKTEGHKFADEQIFTCTQLLSINETEED